MNSMMTHLPNPPPVARSPRSVIFRARAVLVSIAVAASSLLIAVAAWPLKLVVVLAFVRGLFAVDFVGLRNPPRVQGVDLADDDYRNAGSAP